MEPNQADYVDPGEMLLRRVPKVGDPRAVDLGKTPPEVHPRAFVPTDNDTDGISVYREKMVSAQDVADAGPSPEGYWVIRFPARIIYEAGMSVIPTESGPLPGHCSIPEMSKAEYDDKKKEFRRRREMICGRIGDDIPVR